MVKNGKIVVEKPFFDPEEDYEDRGIFCGSYFSTKKGTQKVAVDIVCDAGALPWNVICCGQWEYGVLRQDESCPDDFWMERDPIWAWSHEEAKDILDRMVGEP